MTEQEVKSVDGGATVMTSWSYSSYFWSGVYDFLTKPFADHGPWRNSTLFDDMAF